MTSSTLRPPIAVLIAFAAVVAMTVMAPRTSAAGEASRFDELPPVLPGVDSFRSHPDLLGVDLDSAPYNRARTSYDETAGELSLAFDQRVAAERELTLLAAARERQLGALGAATGRRDSFAIVATELSGAIGELAVEVFMNVDTAAVIETLENPASANQQQRDRALTLAAVNSLVAERNAALENVERAEMARTAAANEIADIDRRVGATTESLESSAAATTVLAPTLTDRREIVETERALADVRGTDLTLVALDAYYRAADAMTEVDPGCGIEWWAIAGISRVEGRHGTFGGSALSAAGTAEPPIIGIPLNGTNGTALIGDSDGGLLDGDPTVDRAVGPMQFIPDTWRRFAADGNGDGEESPHNLYDAAMAAALYLCRSGRGLTTDDALRVAFFSYNRSEAYVTNVLGQSRGYEAILPLGNQSG